MGWTPRTGRVLGQNLLASFDLAALDPADWTAAGTVDLTPDPGGTVVQPVTFTIVNGGNASTFGPDGASGVVIEPADLIVQYKLAAQDAPYLQVPYASFKDAADMDGFTVLAMVAELAGDAPSLDNQTVGIGLDSNSGAAALISSVRALYDTTLKVQTSRTQLLGGKHDLDEGVDPIDWLALRFGHNQFTSWAGEGAAPAHLNETDYRACSGWSATPTKTDGLHNCKTGRWRIFAAADGAAATFAPAISRLSFYEVAG